MRVVSWLLLLVSFCTGLTCAFIVAYYAFDAKPVEVVDRGPTVKILVAQKEIPKGSEIMAEDVLFVDVPVSEIPSQSITNFMQAYRRRPAFPIPAGCPICDDLLIPKEEEATDAVKYLPAGSQIVSLEIEHFRVGETLSETSIPIANILSVGDRIDIRVIPREEAKGEFIQRKNEVLRAFATKASQAGQLVLENVVVHDLLSKSVDAAGKQLQTLSLLLENGDAEKLANASKEGRLRIVPNASVSKDEEEIDRQTSTTPSGAAATDLASSTALPVNRIRVREIETPRPEEPLAESTRNASVEFRAAVVSAENREAVPVEPSVSRSGAHVSFVAPKRSAIRNESDVAAPFVAESKRTTRPASTVVEVGLSYDENELFRKETHRTAENYSPFSTKNRLTEQTETTGDEAPTPPLPLRNRLQWR